MPGPLTGQQAAEAIRQCSHALAARPEYPEAARLLASLLQRYEVSADIDISPRGLRAAFAYADIDRQALCNGAIAFLKGRPPLAEILSRGREEGWNEAAAMLIRQGKRLLRDRLLAMALNHGVVTDIEIEFLLTALRRHLLLSQELLRERPIYEFACLLIRQCLNNEYVFFAGDRERALLAEQPVETDALLDGDASAGGAFMLQALYAPFSDRIGDRATDRVSPRALRALVREEMAVRHSEAALARTLPRMGGPADETSRLVAEQYAGDPYPRWLSLQAPEPGSARERLRAYFTEEALAPLDEACDILIAGAGTGRQAIASAIGYGDMARVQAIDLSAPSLAYAARMAESLGAANLRFAVGDILTLDETETQFDVIECAGVLHHMADPFAGWRALIRRLRPGGLMLIGLYSAASRRIIETLSEEPDWPGPDADDDALRAYRRSLLARAFDGDGVALTQSPDFFTKSGFRDLVLHVSEQRCTILEIRDFMAAEGLAFHGFELPDETLAEYAQTFPDDAPPGKLDNWSAYEQIHPDTFGGMYVFWCRRNG